MTGLCHGRQIIVLLVDRLHRLVRLGRKKPHRRYCERDRWLLSYCLSITEGIVKTIKLYEERELSLAWVLCRMEL